MYPYVPVIVVLSANPTWPENFFLKDLNNGFGFWRRVLSPRDFMPPIMPLCNTFSQVIQEDYSDYKLLMEDETILNSFQNLYGIEKWQKCCKNAVDCCEEMLQNKTKSGNFLKHQNFSILRKEWQ